MPPMSRKSSSSLMAGESVYARAAASARGAHLALTWIAAGRTANLAQLTVIECGSSSRTRRHDGGHTAHRGRAWGGRRIFPTAFTALLAVDCSAGGDRCKSGPQTPFPCARPAPRTPTAAETSPRASLSARC